MAFESSDPNADGATLHRASTRTATTAGAPASGHFPGGTAVSRVRIYDWPTPDGLRGGSPHVHLVCTEGYVVVAGSGRLQTLGPDGSVEAPLRPGDVVWFTPGVIHRAVNDGGLEVLVVMQNAGLPEAGDAVLTMPPSILADPERYAAQMALSSPDRIDPADEQRARRRRDLAVEGFLALRDRVRGRRARRPGRLPPGRAAPGRAPAGRLGRALAGRPAGGRDPHRRAAGRTPYPRRLPPAAGRRLRHARADRALRHVWPAVHLRSGRRGAGTRLTRTIKRGTIRSPDSRAEAHARRCPVHPFWS